MSEISRTGTPSRCAPAPARATSRVSASGSRIQLASVTPSHYITADTAAIVSAIPAIASCRDEIAGRAMLVRRTDPVSFECVVRGYIAGSAWSEYAASGTLAGEPLPTGLRESSRLESPDVVRRPGTGPLRGPRHEGPAR